MKHCLTHWLIVVLSASTSTAAATSASTAAATSASGAGSTSSRESSLDVIARAPLGADGTFRVEAAVDTPRDVYFYVLDAMGHEGQRYAPMKGNEFILEPGNLRLHMIRPGRFYIEGGPYNGAVYNSWRRLDEYVAAEAEYLRLIPSVDGETEDERRARVDRSSATFNGMMELEIEGRARVSTTHPDPLVRRLTIETAWLSGPWMLDAWRGARRNDPGRPMGHRSARAGSELVLVEFWASWRGPCRAEIPHMKEAYAKSGDQGFEIFSFTVDDDRLDWEIASEEEDLPWLDTGKGMEHRRRLHTA